jgi:hypothetical protein
VYVSKFSHMRFEPSGQTDDSDIRVAKSIVDYIFRWMGRKFLTVDQQEEIGILSADVRARMAAAYANGGTDAAEAPAAPAEAAPPGQTALFNAWETQSSAAAAEAGWCPLTRAEVRERPPRAAPDATVASPGVSSSASSGNGWDLWQRLLEAGALRGRPPSSIYSRSEVNERLKRVWDVNVTG